jgi:uncharacterized protein (TIGR03000 family)
MLQRSVLFVKQAAMLTAACLLAASEVQAQDARGTRSAPYPWNAPGYQGYQQPKTAPTTPAAPHTASTPQRYTLHITVLPQKNEEAPETALMIAHLPEDARTWFEDEPTKSTGTLRQFVSPPLTPDKDYTYTVRVEWPENGKWVSQVHKFAVHAGDIHCIDVIPSQARAVDKAIAANLAKLDPPDKQAAEEQRFCAVQEGIRLGSMGVPVKVTVKGRPVFLCCKGCEEKAKADPDKTVRKVENIKAKDTNVSPAGK